MFDLTNKTSYEAKPKVIYQLALSMEEPSHNVALNIGNVLETFVSDIPPGDLLTSKVSFYLYENWKSNSNPLVFKL